MPELTDEIENCLPTDVIGALNEVVIAIQRLDNRLESVESRLADND